mmetsp:Transcript_98411/g.165703  ORF Transcript_98411/g.165703 Transcript_98411/m.165703 type:complete len:217 (+) Transcript_98411:557-1207(+)
MCCIVTAARTCTTANTCGPPQAGGYPSWRPSVPPGSSPASHQLPEESAIKASVGALGLPTLPGGGACSGRERAAHVPGSPPGCQGGSGLWVPPLGPGSAWGLDPHSRPKDALERRRGGGWGRNPKICAPNEKWAKSIFRFVNFIFSPLQIVFSPVVSNSNTSLSRPYSDVSSCQFRYWALNSHPLLPLPRTPASGLHELSVWSCLATHAQRVAQTG